MSGNFSQDDAFSTLGITDFSEVSSSNFVKFASIFSQLDPECQIKALESIPAFVDIAKEALSSYKEILSTECSSNDKSIENYYLACHKIIDALSTLLSNDDLSFDEKREVIKYIMTIEQKMSQKDSENKEFIKNESEKARFGIRAIVVGLAFLGLSALGASIGLSRSANRSN